MQKYEIGVITSALGIDGQHQDTYQAVSRAQALGFNVCQLAWLAPFVNKKGGIDKAINALLPLTEPGNPRLYSICIDYDPEGDVEYWVSNTKDYIRLAAGLGVGRVSQHLEAITADNWGVMIPSLKEIVQYGRDKGVRYALETGNDRFKTMLSITDKVGGIGFCFDPGNLLERGWYNEEILRCLSDLAEYILQVHVKDAVKGNFVVLGEGKLDLKGFVRALDELDYRGPLILEDSRKPVSVRMDGVRKGKLVLDKVLKDLGVR